MREKNRNSIESNLKLPQFTTMNVIDGQAGCIFYSSLILCSLTIDNILNIIVLLILAGVTIATLTGDNGLLQKATNAQKLSDIGEEKEIIGLSVNQVKAENLGEELTRNIIDNALNKNSKENNKARVTDEDEGIFIITFDNANTAIKLGTAKNNVTASDKFIIL